MSVYQDSSTPLAAQSLTTEFVSESGVIIAPSPPKIEASLKMQLLAMLNRDKSVKHAAARVGFALINFTNSGKGYAWPSLERLAEESGCSQAAVKTAIKQLEAAGWLRVERSKSEKGGNEPNRYFMDWNRIDNMDAPKKSAASKAKGSQPLAKGEPYLGLEGGQELAPGRGPETSPNTVIVLDTVRKIHSLPTPSLGLAGGEGESVSSLKSKAEWLPSDHGWPNDALDQLWKNLWPNVKQADDTRIELERVIRSGDVGFQELGRATRSFVERESKMRGNELSRMTPSYASWLKGKRWMDESFTGNPGYKAASKPKMRCAI